MAANCYSKCAEHKVYFNWTITNFRTCRKVCMAHSSIQLSSNHISSPHNIWKLELLFDDPQQIFISLHYLGGTKGSEKIVKACFEVFISGVEKDKTCQSLNSKIYCFSFYPEKYPDTNRSIKRLFSSISTMRELPEELLGNSLTICCDLTEFQGPEVYQPMIDVIPSNMMTDLKKLYENKVNTDFVFLVDKEEFQVHKAILTARSPVFAAMFAHDTIEQENNRSTITDINAETFKLLLEFLYTDNVSNIDEYAMDLLVAANKYQLERLDTICQRKISESITVDNAAAIMAYADRVNAKQLLLVVTNFILQHKKGVAETPGFRELGKTDFDFIIKLFGTNASI